MYAHSSRPAVERLVCRIVSEANDGEILHSSTVTAIRVALTREADQNFIGGQWLDLRPCLPRSKRRYLSMDHAIDHPQEPFADRSPQPQLFGQPDGREAGAVRDLQHYAVAHRFTEALVSMRNPPAVGPLLHAPDQALSIAVLQGSWSFVRNHP